MKNAIIRPATESDCETILLLIKELAEFEKLAHEVVATTAQLREYLFGPNKVASALIAEINNEPAGFALYFFNFSTFLSRPGLYLEDLYVRPQLRGSGIGEQLLKELAHIATQKNCGRMEWAVLNWNERAIAFYQKLGAKPQDEWTVYRLDQKGIKNLSQN